MSESNCCATPLLELLKAVPQDGHCWYEYEETHHQNVPYGRYCHEAVAEIERLTAENERLNSLISAALSKGDLDCYCTKISQCCHQLGDLRDAFLASTRTRTCCQYHKDGGDTYAECWDYEGGAEG